MENNARIDFARFGWLAVQYGAIVFVARALNLDSPLFVRALSLCGVGFLIHYFAPFDLKKSLFVLVGLAVGWVLIAQPDPNMAVGVVHYVGSAVSLGAAIFLALLLFGCLRWQGPYRARVVTIILIAAGIAWLRSDNSVLPAAHWPVLCSLFMFRMIVYAYDVSSARQPETLMDFLTYIFLPPNFYFMLFPVVDYTTFKKSWYADDIHKTAQRGITLITRGILQLCAYRLVYHLLPIEAADVRDFGSLLHFILPAYLMYTRISGQFHVAVGLLHLFGYRLPDANRNYLLADSFTDFWRRINIYWKDFMVKVFYYPVYFRLRKKNERMALIVATAVVFISTVLLHSYQWFWLQGTFQVTQSDLVFWGLLGVLVGVTVLRETASGKSPAARRQPSLPMRAVRILGVYLTISVLWSMWSHGSVTGWFDTVQYWK